MRIIFILDIYLKNLKFAVIMFAYQDNVKRNVS